MLSGTVKEKIKKIKNAYHVMAVTPVVAVIVVHEVIKNGKENRKGFGTICFLEL